MLLEVRQIHFSCTVIPLSRLNVKNLPESSSDTYASSSTKYCKIKLFLDAEVIFSYILDWKKVIVKKTKPNKCTINEIETLVFILITNKIFKFSKILQLFKQLE